LKNDLNDIVHYIKEFKHLIIASFIVIFVFSTITVVGFIHRAAVDVKNQIEYNIYEFNEFDRTHLCNITGCTQVKSVINDKVVYFTPKNRELVEAKEYKEIGFTVGNVTIYPLARELGVTLERYKTVFVVPFPQTMIYVLITISIIVIMLFTAGALYFNYSIRRIRTSDLMSYSSEKTNLQSLITSVLTENLHHEMKTPLASMASELRNIKINLKEEMDNCSSCSRFTPKDNVLRSFDIIEADIKSIYNIIETIKTSKMMRYSNGNRSIYDIIMSAKDITTVTSKVKFFDITIDPAFKKFSLNKFRNEDLLNIIINHLKNSIEANSTKIVFDCPNDKNSHGYLTFYIVDNGNGIPKKALDQIYELHFSTKDTPNDAMRGVGMYLSRQLLRAYGGEEADEWVYETSKDGTTFAIKVPVKYKSK
jgi:signal transduction histidine kinase